MLTGDLPYHGTNCGGRVNVLPLLPLLLEVFGCCCCRKNCADKLVVIASVYVGTVVE